MGERGRFKGTPRPHHVALMLSAEELAVLQAMAEERGMSQSAVLRQALRQYQASFLPRLNLGPKLQSPGDAGG